MLIFSRKIGEGIVIPHCRATVTVMEVTGNRVKLGISAPAEILVLRSELTTRSRSGQPLLEDVPQPLPEDVPQPLPC